MNAYFIVPDKECRTKDYIVSKPDVAVKRFLNFLRRFTELRPGYVDVITYKNGAIHVAVAKVE
jgi:hypothetical protein